MDLLDLPDDCLRLIFDLCPLQNLLPLKRLSSRLHAVIERICTSKKQLKIFGNHYDMHRYLQSIAENYVDDVPQLRINQILDDVLIVKQGTPTSLWESFPSVTSLIISMKTQSEFDLIKFLEPWQQRLISLGLFDLPPTVFPQIDHLWSSINSMTALTKLHLIVPSTMKLPDNLTVISQLDTLALGSYHYDIVPILEHISQKIILVLGFINLEPETLERLLKQRPDIGQFIQGIDLGYFRCSGSREENFDKILQFVCKHFKALEFMDLMFGEHLPLTRLIPALSRLPQLHHLSIYIGRDQLPADVNQLYSLPQLNAVRRLKVEVFDLSLEQFWQWIPALFPSTVKISIKSDFGFEDNETAKEIFVARLKREFKNLKLFRFI